METEICAKLSIKMELEIETDRDNVMAERPGDMERWRDSEMERWRDGLRL